MKLQHHRQRFNECALCAVCTLTGTDYLTASDLFVADHGFPWSDICDLAGIMLYWKPFIKQYTGVSIPVGFFYVTHAIVVGNDNPEAIAWKVRFPYGYHVVAVADGMVYDSALPVPWPEPRYADYLREKGAYIVERFTADELLKGEQTP